MNEILRIIAKGGRYMSKKVKFFILSVVLMGFIPSFIFCQTLNISTDKRVYTPFETVRISAQVESVERDNNVDLYLVILDPQQKLYSIPYFNEYLIPSASDIFLPGGFSQDIPVEVYEFKISDHFQSIGEYSIAGAFMPSGVLAVPWGISIARVNVSYSENPCPDDMVLIPEGSFMVGGSYDGIEEDSYEVYLDDFCIDKYEYPNVFGETPPTLYDFYDAEATCVNLGKTLCNETQWEKACKGPEQTYFPYGNEYDQSKCWYDYYGNDQEALPSGSKPECTNSYGAFDMVGNVSEYAINDIGSGGSMKQRGGRMHWNNPVHGTCIYRHIGSAKVTYQGFRCCK